MMRFLMILSMSLLASIGSAQAKQPLHEVESVWNELLYVGIANEIRENCPTISARTIRAALRLNGIQQDAKGLGYSSDEITDFRTDEANRAEMRKQGAAYLAENGVVADDPESYCALGHAEIAKSSQIGTLLRAN